MFVMSLAQGLRPKVTDPFGGAFRIPEKWKYFGNHRIYHWPRKIGRLADLFQRFRTIMAAPNRSEGERATMSVRLRIISAMQQIATEQQVTLPPLTDDLSLHETGFDSLGFAILVARLEDDLGIDPFTISEDAAFPLTVGDFVRAYENVPA